MGRASSLYYSSIELGITLMLNCLCLSYWRSLRAGGTYLCGWPESFDGNTGGGQMVEIKLEVKEEQRREGDF
jgi:hypothetical protein